MSEELESAVFEIFIAGSVDAVWRELTKTDEVQKAMFDMKMECALTVGAPFRMRSADGKYTGIVGEVLEIEAPKRLAYTFEFTQHDDPPCRIVYELEEADGGTRFRMISDRMPPNTKSTKAMKQGGTMIVENLKSIIETGNVPFKTRVLYLMFKLMAPFTPARLRSENWP